MTLGFFYLTSLFTKVFFFWHLVVYQRHLRQVQICILTCCKNNKHVYVQGLCKCDFVNDMLTDGQLNKRHLIITLIFITE